MDRKLRGVEVLPEVEAIAVLELDGSEAFPPRNPSVTQPSEYQGTASSGIAPRCRPAYGGRCAVSHLPEPRLLDAAHIIMDANEQLRQPIVSNGLPLTKSTMRRPTPT